MGSVLPLLFPAGISILISWGTQSPNPIAYGNTDRGIKIVPFVFPLQINNCLSSSLTQEHGKNEVSDDKSHWKGNYDNCFLYSLPSRRRSKTCQVFSPQQLGTIWQLWEVPYSICNQQFLKWAATPSRKGTLFFLENSQHFPLKTMLNVAVVRNS